MHTELSSCHSGGWAESGVCWIQGTWQVDVSLLVHGCVSTREQQRSWPFRTHCSPSPGWFGVFSALMARLCSLGCVCRVLWLSYYKYGRQQQAAQSRMYILGWLVWPNRLQCWYPSPPRESSRWHCCRYKAKMSSLRPHSSNFPIPRRATLYRYPLCRPYCPIVPFSSWSP